MRVKKGYISKGVIFFKNKFFNRYGLKDISNNTDPVVVFGVYFDEDREFIKNHKGQVIVVWCGSDAMRVGDTEIFKDRINIVTSSFSARDLDRAGLKYRVAPVTPVDTDIKVAPRGDFIYHYGKGRFYGEHLLDDIQKQVGIKIIRATSGTYSPRELLNVYRKCFIGLRLTPHDGLPTTCVELAMMGRRYIFNGDMPHAIPWSGVKDICESIRLEYKSRHEDNKMISEDIKKYINDDRWLNI